MAHKSGVGTSVSDTAGVGVTLGGDVGYGVARTQSVHVSQIAKETAPPSAGCSVTGCFVMLPATIGTLVGILAFIEWLFVIFDKNPDFPPIQGFSPRDSLLIGTLSTTVISVGCFAVAFALSKAFTPSLKKAAEEHKREVDDWANSWICLSCDHRWRKG